MTSNDLITETCGDTIFLGIQLLLRGISRSQPSSFNPVGQVLGGESRSSHGVSLSFKKRSKASAS